MNKAWPLFLLILFLGFYPKLSRAQVRIDLVDCPGCLWIAQDDSIYRWSPQGQATFNPQGIFYLDYESMAIAQVKHHRDTVLNTYILQDFQNQDFKYWNGSQWQALSIPDIDNVIGMGGYGPHFYLLANFGIGDSRIYYYDGDSIKLIHSKYNTVGADLAVDSLGRAWYLSGKPMEQVNFIHMIDSTGQILKAYPVKETFGARNIYGMAIVRDSIYIGVGPDAPVHPSSILTFVIEGDSALLKNVIPQAHKTLYYHDLASYKPGIPNREPEPHVIESKPTGIFIFPNPTSGILHIESNMSGHIKVELFDLRGRKILDQSLVPGNTVDISHLSSAVYVYRLSVQQKVRTGVVVKH